MWSAACRGSGSMQLPLQVTFRNLPGSESVEREVRQHVTHLEAAFPRMISCRALVEVPHRHKHQRRRYRARAEAGIPGLYAVAGHAAEGHTESELVQPATRHAFGG